MKLIDCDTGISTEYPTFYAAYKAVTRIRPRDYEMHDSRGVCISWKMPGDTTLNITEPDIR